MVATLLAEQRELELKIERLEAENERLRSDIDDLLSAEGQLKVPKARPQITAPVGLGGSTRDRVLFLVQACNTVGATTHEIMRATGLKTGSVTARLSELSRQGSVVFSGRYRWNSTGRWAKVWMAKDADAR